MLRKIPQQVAKQTGDAPKDHLHLAATATGYFPQENYLLNPQGGSKIPEVPQGASGFFPPWVRIRTPACCERYLNR